MKKRNVIISTWVGNISLNYGSILQATAMQKIIRDRGFQPITINHSFRADTRFLAKCKEHFNVLWLRSLRYNLTMLKDWFFIKQSMRLSPRCYSDEEVIRFVQRKKPAFLLCGSDAIWKNQWICPLFLWDYKVLFDFPVIAYAPSVQSGEIEYDVIPALQRFVAISGREAKVQDMLKKYTDKKITTVLDPTLTVESSFWHRKSTNRLIKERYILCYILSEAEHHSMAIKNVKMRFGVERVVYVFTDCIDKNENFCYTDYNGKEYKKITGPKQFLSLIKYSEAVCTDSFHGVAFSIVFHKDFFVFGRNSLWPLKSDYRFGDLFSRLQIIDRRVETMDDIYNMKEIDWNKVEASLTIERKKSLIYLDDAIKKSEGEK